MAPTPRMSDPPTSPPPAAAPPWEARENGPRKGRQRRALTWAVGAAVVGAVAYGLRPQPIEVETAAAARGPLTVHVVEEGRTRIRNRYVVAAPVAGRMRRVDLKPGDPVEAGVTVLTAVEPSLAPLLDARSRAEAEARVQAADALVKRAQQNLDLARTASDFAQANWQRVQNVTRKGAISDTDRDAARREALMREREVHSAEFGLKVAEYELAQARAALLQIDAPASGAAVEVRPPVSGVVLRVMQESATVVTPGTPILEVGDTADIEIEAEILSRDAVPIRPGTRAEIEQWGGNPPLAARVRRVEPAAFTKVSALGVEEQRVYVLCDLVDPPDAARSLGDRFRVDVKVAVWHADDTLLVPAGALFREGSQWHALAFDRGRARRVTLDAGRTDGRHTEVLAGLDPGTEVLVHPPDTVTDGTRVRKRVR